MEEKKGSSKKVVWIILFTFITVVLCYLFVVLAFFYISPYNISLKLGLWPFLSNRSIGQMYLDATVEIDFKVWDEENFEYIDAEVMGVNVRRDGYILAPYTELQGLKQDAEIKINTNSGKVFDGKFLYYDENFNVCILKCENIDSNEEIKLPFVKVPTKDITSKTQVIGVSFCTDSQDIWTGAIDADVFPLYSSVEVEGGTAVENVWRNCYELNMPDSFTGGAIFDDGGVFFGFSCQTIDSGDNLGYALISSKGVDDFLDSVISGYESGVAYQNPLRDCFVGFDAIELYYHMQIDSSSENEMFYFAGEWQPVTEKIETYLLTNNFNSGHYEGFYLFENFVFGQGENQLTIEKDNVITKIEVGRKTFVIHDKTDLLKALYSVKSGVNVKIYYQNLDENAQVQSVTIEM